MFIHDDVRYIEFNDAYLGWLMAVWPVDCDTDYPYMLIAG